MCFLSKDAFGGDGFKGGRVFWCSEKMFAGNVQPCSNACNRDTYSTFAATTNISKSPSAFKCLKQNPGNIAAATATAPAHGVAHTSPINMCQKRGLDNSKHTSSLVSGLTLPKPHNRGLAFAKRTAAHCSLNTSFFLWRCISAKRSSDP